MDLIERALIRQEIAVAANPENYDSGNPTMDEGSYGCAENLLYILDNDIPTVDAEPVVHAKVDWRLRHYGGFATVTGFVIDDEGCLTQNRATVRIDMRSKGREPYCGKCGKQLAESSLNYCPHCGAKMDGGDQS